MAPSTSGLGALSVPIASTAMMVGMGGCGIVIQMALSRKDLALLLDFNHFSSLVVSAFATSAMRHLLLVTIGAFRQRLRSQEIMGAALCGPGFRVAAFRIRHVDTSFSWKSLFQFFFDTRQCVP